MRFGKRLHYRRRATLCRRPWCRYRVRQPRGVMWLPSPDTYELLAFFEAIR
jgi:Ni/Co efflux regulator RcnB